MDSNKLHFWSMIFTACVACKFQVRNRPQKWSSSKSIFQKLSADPKTEWQLPCSSFNQELKTNLHDFFSGSFQKAILEKGIQVLILLFSSFFYESWQMSGFQLVWSQWRNCFVHSDGVFLLDFCNQLFATQHKVLRRKSFGGLFLLNRI